MTEPDFWKLIESTKKSDPDEHVERLVGKLAKMDTKEILAFGKVWATLHDKAYTWPLWGAAYLMNGGCSDDGFIDFRSWLILKGEAVYSAAFKEPDSLSKVRVEPDEAYCECYPAPEAYCRAVGGTDHNLYYDAYEKAHGPIPHTETPGGEEWDFDDEAEMKKRLPKVFKKFGES
jgi:hypothetical protein